MENIQEDYVELLIKAYANKLPYLGNKLRNTFIPCSIEHIHPGNVIEEYEKLLFNVLRDIVNKNKIVLLSRDYVLNLIISEKRFIFLKHFYNFLERPNKIILTPELFCPKKMYWKGTVGPLNIIVHEDLYPRSCDVILCGKLDSKHKDFDSIDQFNLVYEC